jgi:hypothetical protein
MPASAACSDAPSNLEPHMHRSAIVARDQLQFRIMVVNVLVCERLRSNVRRFSANFEIENAALPLPWRPIPFIASFLVLAIVVWWYPCKHRVTRRTSRLPRPIDASFSLFCPSKIEILSSWRGCLFPSNCCSRSDAGRFCEDVSVGSAVIAYWCSRLALERAKPLLFKPSPHKTVRLLNVLRLLRA